MGDSIISIAWTYDMNTVASILLELDSCSTSWRLFEICSLFAHWPVASLLAGQTVWL